LFLLSGAACCLIGGFLSDWVYFSTNEIQWKNLADWLILAGLVFGGFALLWAVVDLVRSGPDRAWKAIYFLVLLAAWVIGIIDEFVHAKDAWASMPEALILSGIVAALAIVATVLGLSPTRSGRY
jgi:uncharacterized membrane protein